MIKLREEELSQKTSHVRYRYMSAGVSCRQVCTRTGVAK